MDPSFFLLHVLFAFRAEMGHNPRASARSFWYLKSIANFVKSRDEDLKKLQQLRDSTLTKLVVPTTKIPDEMLGEFIGQAERILRNEENLFLGLLFAELAPVAAIVGGILGQEVIKAISNKDAPHNNYFFYNPLESCGVVETIGYWSTCIKLIPILGWYLILNLYLCIVQGYIYHGQLYTPGGICTWLWICNISEMALWTTTSEPMSGID